MKIIQLQSSVHQPLRNVIDDVRVTVSRVCNGIDEMSRFGNKALIVRAEIYVGRLPALYAALEASGIKVSEKTRPDVSTFSKDAEYPVTLQVIGLSDDTDDRITIPSVPG